ncbi:hypothetical protein T484DRAFT_1879220, partial [Baffinella frigidus]
MAGMRRRCKAALPLPWCDTILCAGESTSRRELSGVERCSSPRARWSLSSATNTSSRTAARASVPWTSPGQARAPAATRAASTPSGLDESVEGGQKVTQTSPPGDDLQIHASSGECAVLRQAEMLDTTTRLLLRLRCKYNQEAKKMAPTAAALEPLKPLEPRLSPPKGFQGLSEMERHAEMTAVAIYRSYVREVLAAGGFAAQTGDAAGGFAGETGGNGFAGETGGDASAGAGEG